MGSAIAVAVLASCTGETGVALESDSAIETGAPITDTSGTVDDTGTAPKDPDDTDSGGTTPTDPDLVSSSSPLFDIFDYTALNSLSGGSDSGYSEALNDYLSYAMAFLTATSANSHGHHEVTLFGDRDTFDRGNGETQTVAYLAITSDYADVAAAPAADTLIRGAEMSGDLGISEPHMMIGLSIIRGSDGTIQSASAVITKYGSDPDANSLHTLLYTALEQKVTVIDNYAQTSTTSTDATELEDARVAAEDLLSHMTLDGTEGAAADYFTIEGDEF